MLYLIDPSNYDLYRSEIDEMYRLRYKVFHERLKWDVKAQDGMEKDEYDEKNAHYIVYKDGRGVIRGCIRIIEMTNPCMFDGPFSFLLPALRDYKCSGYWEISRFAVDHDHGGSYTAKEAEKVFPSILAGIMEFGLYVERVECYLSISYPSVTKLGALYGLLMASIKESEINGETIIVSGYSPLRVPYKKLLRRIGHTGSNRLLNPVGSPFETSYNLGLLPESEMQPAFGFSSI